MFSGLVCYKFWRIFLVFFWVSTINSGVAWVFIFGWSFGFVGGFGFVVDLLLLCFDILCFGVILRFLISFFWVWR